MTNIKICTFNTRGLNDKKKRTDVFDWLKKKKIDICFLQETHSTNLTKKQWETEWDYNAFFASHTSNSRGVAILFNNTFQFNLKSTICDPEGRYIFLDISINDKSYSILNVYGPNNDEPNFFELLKIKLEQVNNENIIIGGDFNVVQDYDIDTLNISNKQNTKSNECISKLKDDLDLYDPWRHYNENSKIYTWHNSRNQHSRLDYFLVSPNIINQTFSTAIKPGYRSDHSLVIMNIKLTDQIKGKGLWKFNNSLLKNEDYTNEIKECISDTLNRYKAPNARGTDYENWQFTIGDQPLFEILKMEIRGRTISFSSALKNN